MRRAFPLLLAAGCGFSVPGQPPGDAIAPTGDGAADGSLDASVDAPPDAPPPPPCPPPPSGCVAFECESTSCHYVCNDKRGWTSARDRCVALNLGCLATINSTAENACIAAAAMPMFGNQTYAWFGFVQTTTTNEPAGGWAWQCQSSTFVAGNWGAFEPNDDNGNEDCGIMSDGGAWLDGVCSTNARYICERPR